jgi:uncharacterized membrane protein (DUF4010 family)
MIDSQGAAVGLAAALGCGLLIGVDRERHKGDGDERAAAGLRSFAVVALSGALAQLLSTPGLVAVGAVLVGVLAAVSHWKSRSRDPGMTTELALFATYLIGVLSMLAPAMGAACGAALALLLAERNRLHRFATQLLSEQELRDGVLLAALTLAVLPLIPSQPLDMLGGIAARPLAGLVILILAIQAAGQMAVRWLGARGGTLGLGLLSGFVSSTATVASLGARARKHPRQIPLLAGGAALSAVATWLQVLIISAALSATAAVQLLPSALAGAAGALACGLAPLLSRAPASAEVDAPAPTGSALHPREALSLALALALVALLVGTARHRFGDTGLMAGVALAALADAHSPVASLASLQAAGSLSDVRFVQGTLVAVGVNTLSRCAVAAFTGGRAYALRVGAALLTSFAFAALGAAWTLRG